MAQNENVLEYVKSLNVRRKRRRMMSWGLIILGVVTYLDAGWRFPIWLTGIWAFALGTPLIIIGVVLLFSTYKLPIREALLFASLRQGKVSVPTLAMGLDITLETAELIVDHLTQKGYAQVSTEDMEEGVIVYKISGVEKFLP
ncbi:hypothetical protein U27_04611 [Candidatus Vecturithrix granuli]|uniref:Uncharacterized protein n=1 Tax=Vecturithrix granuli TaxID=1499967 RepID=A0A081BZ89_VECG1|nr:hypothetical protein U27_04611 [Candidatus Vecturithrix granuli]